MFLGYAHVLIGLLMHVRRCVQRLYILTTSEDSGGRESLAPLFWGSWAEKFGSPWSKEDLVMQHLLATATGMKFDQITQKAISNVLSCIHETVHQLISFVLCYMYINIK